MTSTRFTELFSHDIPTCRELIDRSVAGAEQVIRHRLRRLAAPVALAAK